MKWEIVIFTYVRKCIDVRVSLIDINFPGIEWWQINGER
jgi:hypothetical protein